MQPGESGRSLKSREGNAGGQNRGLSPVIYDYLEKEFKPDHGYRGGYTMPCDTLRDAVKSYKGLRLCQSILHAHLE